MDPSQRYGPREAATARRQCFAIRKQATMKRCRSLLLAASSLLWLAVGPGVVSPPALAESRPRYGGTLRVTMKAAPPTLDPATAGVPATISRLIFETLVSLDAHSRPQPLLASSWQSDPGSQR